VKFLGHPIHALLIHFPTALLPMDAALAFFSYYQNETIFAKAGFYCLIAGVLTGWLAMFTGVIDLLRIPKQKKAAIGNGFTHGIINGSLIMIYSVLVYKGWQLYPNISVPSTTMLITKAILVVTLFAGNFLGGKLIYKHHIGIDIKEQNG
jgi:uncharacterized membrane protein